MVAVVDDRVGYAGPAAGFTGDLPPAAPDRLLLPGLVDLHCHGGAGGGFPDDDLPAVRAAAGHHHRHGTTTLVASLVSAPAEHLHRRLDLLRPLVAAGELAGVHLEGPFLAAARCGAQDPAALLPGDPQLLDELLAGGGVVSVTLAPETAHADELVAVCRAHGVLPSFGHTDATAARTAQALRSAAATGRVSATHLFNGMPPMLSRAPGPVAPAWPPPGAVNSSWSWSPTVSTSRPRPWRWCSTWSAPPTSRWSATPWPPPGCRTATTGSAPCR